MGWLQANAPYVIAALQLLVFLGSLWLSKHFASRLKVEANESNTNRQFMNVNLRLQRVEDALASAPTHKEMRSLERQLSAVSSDIKRVEPWIKGLSNHVDMLLEKELRNK
ncbi:DUF2730 family protein [Pseudidiomarina aestuarii]|uniref:DUF2730 family protein n=1 Tax=Pseudidiomarina aestuarii TaxID=624146 RepID=UPI003A981193